MTELGADQRSLFRRWPAGVSVVVAEADGRRHGLTVSSLLSLSLEPPLVGISISRQASLHELLRSAHLPLHLPLPQDPRLLNLCQAFLKRPDAHVSPVQWAAQLPVSLRSFNRLFSWQTGLSFSQWRQQACVMSALSRLVVGDSVTRIALDLGYDSPAAFSTMFRRILGHAPSAWLEKTAGH